MAQRMRGFFYTLMFLLLIPGPKALCAEEPSTEAQRITSIMNKVIEAYGGKDIIEGIHSLQMPPVGRKNRICYNFVCYKWE